MRDKSPWIQSNTYVIFFIIVLCSLAGGTLAIIAFLLTPTQEAAKKVDQSKQMLIAAKVIEPKEKALSDDEIKEIALTRIRPLLTDAKGNVFTLEEKGIKLDRYLEENQKEGYASQPLKLFYAILPPPDEGKEVTDQEIVEELSLAQMFVIPISGFGLWAPIYGYLAIESNGDTVVGTTWYEHAETPGLGANIAESWWQKQFEGKLIFEESSSGETNFETAQMGIIVVKGKVSDVYGTSPKSKSAVDGMSGATLTGDGVTNAYRNSLQPYRAFLIKLHEANQGKGNGDQES